MAGPQAIGPREAASTLGGSPRGLASCTRRGCVRTVCRPFRDLLPNVLCRSGDYRSRRPGGTIYGVRRASKALALALRGWAFPDWHHAHPHCVLACGIACGMTHGITRGINCGITRGT